VTTTPQQHILDKISLNILRLFLFLFLAWQLVVPAILAIDDLYPARIGFLKTPEDYSLDYQVVEINNKENEVLRAWLLTQKDKKSPGVLLVHDKNNNRSQVLDLASFLYQEGYSVLLFDLRAHGLSDGNKISFGIKEKKDIEQAFKFFARQKNVDENNLGIYALGYSASWTILSEEQDFVKKANKVLILDSAYSSIDSLISNKLSWNHLFIPVLSKSIYSWTLSLFVEESLVNPIDLIKNIEKPILFIHSAEDNMLSKSNSIDLNEAKIFGEKELWLVPLLDHLESYEKNKGKYREKVLEMLNKNLKNT